MSKLGIKNETPKSVESDTAGTTNMECGITECCGYDFGEDAFKKNKPKFYPMCGKRIIKVN